MSGDLLLSSKITCTLTCLWSRQAEGGKKYVSKIIFTHFLSFHSVLYLLDTSFTYEVSSRVNNLKLDFILRLVYLMVL